MSTPGNGDFARIISPTSGREWYGEVLVWGPKGAPFLRDAETAEVRWFPASWVKATIGGPPDFDRGPCSCTAGAEYLQAAERNPGCPHHGDPEHVASLILQAARRKTP